ncbi:MAG: iron complex outerrane recepter protein [Campylobacterota bacterium]|nr:iron complex outerrane recepter protein [Campylobacterota bacterium]
MKTITLSALAIFAIGTTNAMAESIDLGDISVTATKTEQASSDSPASVTVISNAELKQRNVSRVSDALLMVPGLSMGTPMNGQMSQGVGSGTFTLRGMNASRTAVLIDGVPLVDGFSSKVDFRTVLTDDVERIEVVPGAFSSLYGSNAIGGVINIITKKSSKPETTIRYKKGFGDAEGNDFSLYHRSKNENGLGVVLGFGREDRTGYVNEFVVKTPGTTAGTTPVTGGIPTTTATGTPAYIVGDKGEMAWTQNNATLKLDYDLDPKSKIYGGVTYNVYKMDQGDYHSYLYDLSGNPVVNNTSMSIDGSNKISLTETDFASTSPLENGSIRTFAGYNGLFGGEYDTKFEISKAEISNWYNEKGTGATFYSGPGSKKDNPSEALDVLAQTAFAFNDFNYLTIGINQRNTELDRKVYTLTSWRDEDSITGSATEGAYGESSASSVFLQDEIALSDAFTVYLGGRYDRWETQGNNFKIGTGAYQNDFDKRSDSAFSPKLSVVYLPIDDVTLRASVGKSFRAPDNYELYGTLYCCGKYYQSNPDLKPEIATTYEIGGEWRPTSDLKTVLSLYQTTLEDMIYGKTIDATHVEKANAGEARVRGIELSMNTNLTSWLNLDMAYSYIDSEVLKNDAEPLTIGNKLVQTPTHMWSAALSTKYENWSGLIETKYSDSVYSTELNTPDVGGVFGSWDSYWLSNAKIEYQINKELKASISVNNLTDETIYQYYLLPGRNITTELVMTF